MKYSPAEIHQFKQDIKGFKCRMGELQARLHKEPLLKVQIASLKAKVTQCENRILFNKGNGISISFFEKCMKCGVDVEPLDAFCDNCLTLDYAVEPQFKKEIIIALLELGYSYKEDSTCSVLFFIIPVTRGQHTGLLDVLDEITNKGE